MRTIHTVWYFSIKRNWYYLVESDVRSASPKQIQCTGSNFYHVQMRANGACVISGETFPRALPWKGSLQCIYAKNTSATPKIPTPSNLQHLLPKRHLPPLLPRPLLSFPLHLPKKVILFTRPSAYYAIKCPSKHANIFYCPSCCSDNVM